MFCVNCGAEVADGAKFCPKCGTPIAGVDADQARVDATIVQPRPTAPVAYDAQPANYAAPQNQPAKPKLHTGAIVGGVITASLVAVLGVGMYNGFIPNPLAAQQAGQSQDSSPQNAASSSDKGKADSTDSNGTSGTGNNSNSSSQSSASSSSSESSSTSPSEDPIDYSDGGWIHSKAYGYVLQLPSSFIPSDMNTDEKVVFMDGDVYITLTADTNPSGQTVDDAYAAAKATLGDDPYSAQDDNWYVISDVKDSQVRYVMSYVESGRRATMEIDYPLSDKDHGSEVVNQVQPTFELVS